MDSRILLALLVIVFIALSYHFQFELNEPKIAVTIFILGVLFWTFVIYRREVQHRWRMKRGKEHRTDMRRASYLAPKLGRPTFFILLPTMRAA